MGKAVIERFEGDMAVLEEVGDSFVDVPRSDLPAGAKVGDVVVSSGGRYVVDAAETAARKDRAAKLAKGLFKD